MPYPLVMAQTDYASCFLCEACCGLAVTHDGDRIESIRGDREDPFSKGYVCPKAAAITDLQHDPDRLRKPLRRVGTRWTEIGFDEAIEEAAERIASIQKRHGRNSVAMYRGNPGVHNYAALLVASLLRRTLGTKNNYSAGSVDSWPRLLASYWMYGAQTVLPIPDLDRTDYLLILGANPAVSNGSVMTAPGCGRRLREIRERGGTIVVVDPRRTETAELASQHRFIRPGTDALFLLALLRTIFAEDLAKPEARIQELCDGFDRVTKLVEPFTPDRVAEAVGIEAEAIREIARGFAQAQSAVCYGRLGTCTQEFGTLCTWLIDVLNIATGNFDRPGGVMFPKPAIDLSALAGRLGQGGSYGRWKSRVSGYPEFSAEYPVAALAEEIETPGAGQIRGLVTYAGNPVLSLPNGRRLDAAFESLDFMVSIDIYRNETTRHADLIIPPTFGFEHDHYPIVLAALGVRNFVRYSRPLLKTPRGALEDWEIQVELARALARRRGDLKKRLKTEALGAAMSAIGPKRVLSMLLRRSPYENLTMKRLLREPHGVDLGALAPRMPDILRNASRRIDLVPERLVQDVGRAERVLAQGPSRRLRLIGRRDLRSNNSWMHNSQRLIKGKDRCQLLMHPDDAASRGIANGDRVCVDGRSGSVEVAVQVTGAVMSGIVSLPHGWGHDREGAQLSVALERPGVSINDLTDDAAIDAVSGTTNFSGIPVDVRLRT